MKLNSIKLSLKQWFSAAILVSLSAGAQSEILEVYRWQATPGMDAQMLETWRAAKAIHEEVGATVYAFQGDVGTNLHVNYLMRWDSEAQWGASKDALAKSLAWQAMLANSSAESPATLQWSMRVSNLDSSVKADSFDDGKVFSVFIWKPAPGQTATVVQNFAKAKQIHTALGARVESYLEGVGGVGNLHYTMAFKNWAAMADFNQKLASSEAWANLRAEIDPESSTLIDSFTGSLMPL